MRNLLTLIFILSLAISVQAQQVTISTNGVKNPLVEATGTARVQFEPDGTVFLNNVKGNYPNAVIVQHHPSNTYKDAMEHSNATGWAAAVGLTAYPTAAIDRKLFSGQSAIAITRPNYMAAVAQQNQISPNFELTLRYSYNSTSRVITAALTGKANSSLSGDYYLNLYVVEDSVTGTGSGYDQANFYNTQTGHPYFGAGNPIVGFNHRNVVRNMLGGVYGTAAFTNPTANTTYTQNYTYTIPSNFDPQKIHLVGTVAKYSSTNPNDREVQNAIQSNGIICAGTPLNITITPSGPTTFCQGDSVTLTGNTGTGWTYLWLRNNMPIMGSNTNSLTFKQSGVYQLSVLASGNCPSVSQPITVNVQEPENVQICIVTADTVSGKNLIVWEKSGIMRAKTYKIYRETTTPNVFQLIGSQAANVFSTFEDTAVNPQAQSYGYKVTLVDSCNNELPLDSTSVHRTLNVQFVTLSNNNIYITWVPYVGRAYNTVSIMRSNNNGAWTQIAQVPNTATSYTDANPPSGVNSYRLEIQLQGGACSPSAKTTAYATIVSNATVAWHTDVQKVTNNKKLNIYPNPANDIINIVGLNTSNDIVITDITGRQVLHTKAKVAGNTTVQLDIKSLQQGMYILKAIDAEGNTSINKFRKK